MGSWPLSSHGEYPTQSSVTFETESKLSAMQGLACSMEISYAFGLVNYTLMRKNDGGECTKA
jgi:hypothetical protein